MRFAFLRPAAAIGLLLLVGPGPALADTTPQPLPFSQDWSNTGLITIANDWSGVPGLIGHRGDGLAGSTGVDPQTILAEGTATPVNVIANQANPNTNNTGGIAEFEIANPTIAMQGSGTARAPFVMATLVTSGLKDIRVRYTLRDLDSNTDNAVQPMALHYRIGTSGDFTNVPAAFVADASEGPSVSGPDIPVDVVLPADAGDQPVIQIRWMTADAVGSDEWIGIDDIEITGSPLVSGPEELFFSEYVEGSGSNKAIEIYNGTGADVNLTGYSVRLYANGAVTPTQTLNLSGTLADGDVYVIGNPSAAVGITSVSDILHAVTNFNGDDALTLLKDGVVIDAFGRVGEDPGAAWTGGGVTTLDKTLRRKPEVCQGDAIEDDAFDPSLEWLQFDVDSFDGLGSHTATCVEPPGSTLSFIDDAIELAEGDAGTTDFVFEIDLDPVPTGAVSFDLTLAPGAVNPVDQDDLVTLFGTYPISFDPQTDTLPIEFVVQVAADTTPEPDETFVLTADNFSAGMANAAPVVATATILNDDAFPITPISSIQGDGQLSPLDGELLVTQGIVTGIRSNSFFIQTPDGLDDGDPETSEGLYVFVGTGNVPPALAVGDLVTVRGQITEFIPPADPYQLPITELVNVDLIQIDATGQTLPAPITLDPLDPDGAIDQLERYEFMRVRIPAFTVTAPTRSGGTDEYFGVIAGNDIPRREPGVDIQNPLPAEAPANVPRWDANPELIRVKSNLLVGGAAVPMRAGTELEELVGVLDYAFRRYTVLTTAAAAPVIVSTPEGTATSAALPQDVTIGAFNVENYSGTSGTVFERKTNKFSEVIRDFLGYPDILGIVEVASIDTLNLLAQRINTQAVDAGDPNPLYTAHIESNAGTQRLGFLIKTALSGGAPRVQILNIEERDLIIDGQPAGVLCPDGETRTTGLLNDRPPLVLDALVTGANGAEYTVTVINNHLKSLIGVDSEDPAGAAYDCFNFDADGTPIPTGGEGRRNRAKRQQEAEFLAGVVDEIQQTNPGRPVVLVGDFNAFEFNDGLADVMGTLSGVPSPDDETVVPGDGIDFLDPDLIPMAFLVDEDQRYSYVFSGTRQVLDHVVINEAVVDTTVDVRKEFARVNADFTNVDGTSTLVPFRSSDHDPTKAYLTVSAFFTADLRVFDASVDPAQASVGDPVTFALKLENLGGDGSVNPGLLFDLPAGVGFASVAASPGWTCSPPVSGASGQFGCFADSGSLAQLDVVEFTLEVEVLNAAAGTTVLLSADASGDSTDPVAANNSASGQIEVAALADLALSAQAREATVPQGDVAIVDFSAENLGPNPAADASLALSVSGLNPTEPLPQVLAPAGWTCGEWVVAVGIANAECTAATFPVGNAGFEVSVSTSTLTGSNLSFQGEISAATTDPVGGNEQASAGVSVSPVADLQASLSNLPAVAQIGQEIQFTATLDNLGPSGGAALAGSELQVDLNVASDAVDYENDGLGILLCSVESVSASSSRVVCVDSVGLAAQAGSSVIVKVVVPAALSLQSLDATASASGPVVDPDSSNNVVAGSIAINTAPTVEDASFLVLIGTPNGFVVGQVEAADADGDELAFSLTAGNGDGAFAIDSDGVLTVANSAAITGGRSLTVTVQDGRGGSASAAITITTSDPLEQLDIFSNGFED